MNSSVHIDNEEKDILIPEEGLTQTLDDATLTAKAKYQFKNLSVQSKGLRNKRLCTVFRYFKRFYN